MNIMKHYPFRTPNQIMTGIRIKRSVESNPAYKYVQKKKNHNPYRFSKVGYGFSYQKPSLLTRIKEFLKENVLDCLMDD